MVDRLLPDNATSRGRRAVALAAGVAMIASGALAGAFSASAATEEVYWNSVAQVSGVNGRSTETKAMAMRPGGIPIVAGQFRGVASFPTGPDTSVTLTDDSTTVFVSALTPDGTYFDWVTKISGVGGFDVAAVNAVAVSADDTLYVGGAFYGASYFPTGPAQDDSIALVSPDANPAAFVAAIAPGSQYFAWAQKVGKAVGNSNVKSISVMSDGAPVVTGFASGTNYFPTGGATPDDSVTLSGNNLYVAAMKSGDSTFAWVRPIAQGNQGSVTSIAVTQDDTTVVTGYFTRSLIFPTGPTSSVTLTNDDTWDLFVAAISADDSYFSWAQRAGDDSMVGSASALSQSLALALDGSPIITGNFANTAYFPTGRPAPDDSIAVTSAGSNDIFIAALNADDSYFAWVQRAGGTGSDVSRAIAVSPSGEPLVVGDFTETAYFPAGGGNESLGVMSTGDRDVFVAQMSADDSTFSWVQRAGGQGGDFGYAAVAALTDRPFVGGRFGLTADFPTSVGTSLSLTAVGSSNAFAGSLAVATGPVPPAPPIPSSEPRSVMALAGDASVEVSWSAPSSSGSYPITNYQVTAAPGGRTCLVSAPMLSCDVSGLTNGTAYTFAVTALTGAGWSPASEPSNMVIPHAAVQPSVVITGSRDGSRIQVTGSSTGLAMGAILNPWVKLAGQSAYSQGTAEVLVSMNGTFEWGRKTGKRSSVYVQTPDGSVRSNTVTIAARS